MNSIEKLINDLKSRNWIIRKKASEALGKRKAKSAVPELIKLLKDEFTTVRLSAVNALGEIGDKIRRVSGR